MAEFVSLFLVLSLLITSAMMWHRVLRCGRSKLPHILSPRKSNIAALGFVDVLAAVLIAGASQGFAVAVIMQLTGIGEFDFFDERHLTLINLGLGTAQLLASGLILLYLFKRYSNAAAAGLSPATLTQDLKLGFYGFILFVPPMLLLQSALTTFWEYEHPTMDMISPDSSLLSIVSAWWMAIIVAPVSEEILFRVVLLGWLIRCFANPHDFIGGFIGGQRNPPTDDSAGERIASVDYSEGIDSEGVDSADRYPYHSSSSASFSNEEIKHDKTWAPVLIVALLFAVVHIGQGPAPIPIFFLGLGLCYMYRQTESVVPCIVTHFLLNTFSMTVFTIEQFYFPNLPEEEILPDPVSAIELFMGHWF